MQGLGKVLVRKKPMQGLGGARALLQNEVLEEV